ncbi:N-acetylneuraminate synthase family protein [Methanobrevibacter sp.]|uniref:N-acetylneuraminate synthase family protein n=1 Tax=Methanobrevibacter sp. TaxID=66852 RepID=UPI00388D18B6
MKVFNKSPFLIADISLNLFDFANQEKISLMESALFLIDEAKSCGVDGVMFQSYTSENIISRDSSIFDELYIESPNDYFDSLRKYDKLTVEEYRRLAEYCHEIGVVFLSTPNDFESVDYLDEFMDVFKISSSDLTNIPFIKHVASKNKPILLSTGGATIGEIKQAVRAIEDVSISDIVIMHSVLSFPTRYEDANLLMIKDLAENFPEYEIGYSDHTMPDENMMVLTTAFNYGASVLEKHFTFDKKIDSLDSSYAMDGDDVINFKRNVLFLSKINGRRNKQPLICESLTRKEIRKSIVSDVDIKCGEIINESHIAFKRPGVGISPSDIDDVIGKKANQDIPKDTVLKFEMLEN